MERRILGHGETQTWSLTFEGDKVTVNFEDTDDFKAELRATKEKGQWLHLCGVAFGSCVTNAPSSIGGAQPYE
jgi:hypothetical protein